LRQFGWLLALVLAVAGWRIGPSRAGLTLQATAALVFAVGSLWPAALRGIYLVLLVLTFPVGWALSRVLLAVVFYGLITPLALGFRLAGRDPLQRRADAAADTYWQPRPQPADARRYFRQF
jgi:hypothetical protein